MADPSPVLTEPSSADPILSIKTEKSDSTQQTKTTSHNPVIEYATDNQAQQAAEKRVDLPSTSTQKSSTKSLPNLNSVSCTESQAHNLTNTNSPVSEHVIENNSGQETLNKKPAPTVLKKTSSVRGQKKSTLGLNSTGRVAEQVLDASNANPNVLRSEHNTQDNQGQQSHKVDKPKTVSKRSGSPRGSKKASVNSPGGSVNLMQTENHGTSVIEQAASDKPVRVYKRTGATRGRKRGGIRGNTTKRSKLTDTYPSVAPDNGSVADTGANESPKMPADNSTVLSKSAPRGRKRSAFGVIHRKRKLMNKETKVIDRSPVNGQVRIRKVKPGHRGPGRPRGTGRPRGSGGPRGPGRPRGSGRPRLSLKKESGSDSSPTNDKKDLLPLADPEEIEQILMMPVDETVKEEQQDSVDETKSYIGYDKASTKPRKDRIKKDLRTGRYKCPYCSFQSQYYSAVSSHTLIHTGEKPYKCQICDYRARQRGHIVVHMRIHSGSKPYSCPDCNYATIQRSHLRVHMQVHSSERPYQCHTCAYRSKHRSILKAHMKKYGHQRAYSCTECSYSSSRKHNLLQHMTLHTGLKPYKCDLCSYESNQKGHLNVHIRTHTREKPFKCDECPFASTVPKSLREHMTMHQGSRPLQCPYCSFSTSQPFSIKNHIALHEDTKMYKCKFCSYSTSIEKDFQTHRSIHVQSSSYCCTMCTFTTPFKHQFDNHLISHGDSEYKDKATWDRKIKMENLSPPSSRGRKKRLRSTSRKPLQLTANGISPRRSISPGRSASSRKALSPGRSHSPANVYVNCVTNTSHSISTSTDDLICTMENFSPKNPSAIADQPLNVKTEVAENTTNGATPNTNTVMAPPKAVTRLHHQTRVTNMESSKLHYKVYKPDIIRRKMAGIAKFFCDYCARPFVEHEDWKRHVIRHFMMWPEIDGY